MKKLFKLCLLLLGLMIVNLTYSQSELTSKEDMLFETYQKEGFDKMIAQYEQTINAVHKQERNKSFNEDLLNNLGYHFMTKNLMAEALKVFELNAKNHPKSANCYDSWAEASLKSENKEKAIEYYKRALELNPDFDNPRNVLISLNVIQLDTIFSRKQLEEDLGMIMDAMILHPKLYEYTSKKEFEILYKQIQAKLKDDMTADDFLKLAYPLLERIGCGHSSLLPSMSYFGNPEGKTVPISVRFEEDKTYILKTFPEGEIPIGSRLLSINDKPINEIASELTNYFSTDGLINQSGKRYAAGRLFELMYPKFFIPRDKYKFEYQAYGSDEILELELDAFDINTIWMPKMMNQNPFHVEYRKDLDAAVIKLKTFWFGGNNDKYYAFLDSTFAKIKEEKIQNVILDLRGNGGGDPIAAARLFSYIAPKPLKYYADVFSAEYAILAQPIELAKNHFDGHLFTIIDGGGYSTTGHIVSLIKYHKIGLIVGSELGSTYTCNDNKMRVHLKHTRLTLSVARSTFTTAVENMKADQGVLPDYPIDFSVDDLVKGVDTEMGFIIKMIN